MMTEFEGRNLGERVSAIESQIGSLTSSVQSLGDSVRQLVDKGQPKWQNHLAMATLFVAGLALLWLPLRQSQDDMKELFDVKLQLVAEQAKP